MSFGVWESIANIAYLPKCRYKDVGRKALKSLRMSLWWMIQRSKNSVLHFMKEFLTSCDNA